MAKSPRDDARPLGDSFSDADRVESGPAARLREVLTRVEDPVALVESLFVRSPVPCMVFDAEGHPLLHNPAYARMFGAVPPPEYCLFRDEVVKRLGLDATVRRAFQGESVETPTFWYDPKELEHVRTTEAKRVAISCTAFPLVGASGAITHVAIMYDDVTAELETRERAEAERDRLQAALRDKDQLASALRHSEERLRHTLEAADVGFWEWNVPENRIEWSPNIERIFGLPPGTFAGTYDAWLALVHPEDREAMTRRVAAALERREPYEAEFRFLHADGSTGWQSTRGYVVADEEGRPRLLRGIVMDVTARKNAAQSIESLAAALRESEARYRSFVSQSTEGIWRCEADQPVPVDLPIEEQVEAFYRHGYLAECNDAFARMYGFERAEELIGTRLDQMLVREDPRNFEYLRAFVASGYRLRGAPSHEVDREGRRRVFQNSLIGIVENGKLVRAWGTQQDVTGQVEAREQAEAANRAKDEFLAMLGHELRNPLSPILTALQLMRLRGGNGFERERSVIERQVQHVVRLVDDLLDVSRMTRGKISLDRRRLHVADAVASAIELASPLLEQRAHRLSVEVPRDLIVDGDPTRLAQVFANLLTNAAKYTPPNGTIEVSGDRIDERVRIRVRDDGIGIAPEMLPRVFDLFAQERQTLDRSQGGLGLGLAIVRSLVGLHGGTVRAESAGVGQGSTFTVLLPPGEASAHSATPEPLPAAARRAEARHVLVVDDNADAAHLLADALVALGHSVSVAHDGPTALRLLDERVPDVALLDIGLPVMDGYELARRIRASDRLRGVRLFAVTGYGQEKDRAAALEAGFDEHLVKPIDLGQLERVTSLPARARP